MSKITVDITAINMNGSGAFSSTVHITTEAELKSALKHFEEACPFSDRDVEAYAEHEDGSPLTDQERAWFQELGIQL